MQYLRRMVLVFTCVMLMGGITACGNMTRNRTEDRNVNDNHTIDGQE